MPWNLQRKDTHFHLFPKKHLSQQLHKKCLFFFFSLSHSPRFGKVCSVTQLVTQPKNTRKNLHHHHHHLSYFVWAELHKRQDRSLTPNDWLISQRNIWAIPLKMVASLTALLFGWCKLLLLQKEKSLCKWPQREEPWDIAGRYKSGQNTPTLVVWHLESLTYPKALQKATTFI